jgi:RNA-directed DNA polymerase
MKRLGYLYEKICTLDNLILAESKARKGKTNKKDVIEFDLNKHKNLLELQKLLINQEFKNSEYHVFTIFEGKERIIYKLPYYPDRIVHHAIMNILEPIFINSFTSNTYNCIKGRGIHKGLLKLNKTLQNKNETTYCLKLDIHKFYPNVNHVILKKLLSRKFKDKKLLNLLYIIIDSASGLPIGNYLSQFLANFYLSYFDHWLKEELKIKYYFRYCDDLVMLLNSKEELHIIKNKIRDYLKIKLDLNLKPNWQIFPVNSRGIDFLGYKSYHNYILLRKSIKNRFIKMVKYNYNSKSLASYNGWLKWCNSKNLKQKYIKNE